MSGPVPDRDQKQTGSQITASTHSKPGSDSSKPSSQTPGKSDKRPTSQTAKKSDTEQTSQPTGKTTPKSTPQTTSKPVLSSAFQTGKSVPISTSTSAGKAGPKSTSRSTTKSIEKSTTHGAAGYTASKLEQTAKDAGKDLADAPVNQSETARLIKTLSLKLAEIMANARDNNAEDRDMILLLQSTLDAARKRTEVPTTEVKSEKSSDQLKSTEGKLKSPEKPQAISRSQSKEKLEEDINSDEDFEGSDKSKAADQSTGQQNTSDKPVRRPIRRLTRKEWSALKRAAEDAMATGETNFEQAIINEAKKVDLTKDKNQDEKTSGSTIVKSWPGDAKDRQLPVKPPPMARFKAEKRKALERKAAKEAKKACLEMAQVGQTTTAHLTQSHQKSTQATTSTATTGTGPILSSAVQAVKAVEKTISQLMAASESGSASVSESSAALAAQLKAIETLTDVASRDLPPSLQSVVKDQLAAQQARITAQQLSKQTPPPSVPVSIPAVSIPGLGGLDNKAPTTTTTAQQPAVPPPKVPFLRNPNTTQFSVPRGPPIQPGIPMGFRAQLAVDIPKGVQNQPHRGQVRGPHPPFHPRGPLLGQARGLQTPAVIQRGPQPAGMAPPQLGRPPQVTASTAFQQAVSQAPNLRGNPAFPNLPVMRPPGIPSAPPLFPSAVQAMRPGSVPQMPPPQTSPFSQAPPRGPPPRLPISQSLDYYIQRKPATSQSQPSKPNIQSKNSTEEATQELDKILSKNQRKKLNKKKGPQPKLAFNVKKIEAPKQIQPVPVSRLVAAKEKVSGKQESSEKKQEKAKMPNNLFGNVIDHFNKLQEKESSNASKQDQEGKRDLIKDSKLNKVVQSKADEVTALIDSARARTADEISRVELVRRRSAEVNAAIEAARAKTAAEKKSTEFSEEPKTGKSDSKSRQRERKSRFENSKESSKASKKESDRERKDSTGNNTLVTRAKGPVPIDKISKGSRSLSTGSRSPTRTKRSPGRKSPDRFRRDDRSRTRLSPEYSKDRGSSGRKSPSRADPARDPSRSRHSPDHYHRQPSPGRSVDRARMSSDRLLKSGRSPDRYRNKSPPREIRSADQYLSRSRHSPDPYSSSGRLTRSPDHHLRGPDKRSPERGMDSRYSSHSYDSHRSLSPYSHDRHSRRSLSPLSHRQQSQEMYISRSPVRYPHLSSSTQLSPKRYNSPSPYGRPRSRSPIRYHDQVHSRSISPGSRLRSRSPDPRLRRSRSPDPRFRRSRSPDSRFRRSMSPDPRFRRSVSPDPRFRRSRSPDPRFRRSISPDPRSRRSRSPDPRYRHSSDHRSRRSRSPGVPSGPDVQMSGANMSMPNFGPNQYGNNMPTPNVGQMPPLGQFGNQFPPNAPPPNINQVGNPIANPFNNTTGMGPNQFGNLGPNQFGNNMPPPNSVASGNMPPPNVGPYGNLPPNSGPFGNQQPNPGPGQFGNQPPNLGPGQFGNQTNFGPGPFGNPINSRPGQFGSPLPNVGPGQFGNQTMSGPGPMGNQMNSGPRSLGNHMNTGPGPIGNQMNTGPGPIGNQMNTGPGPIGNHMNTGPGPIGNQRNSGISYVGNQPSSGQGQFGNQSSGSSQIGNQINSGLDQIRKRTGPAPDQLKSRSSDIQQSNMGSKRSTSLMPPPSSFRDQAASGSSTDRPGSQGSQSSTGQPNTNKPPVLKGILKKKTNNPPASEQSTASSIWQSLTGVNTSKSETTPPKRFTSGALSSLQESYKEPTGAIPSHIVQKLQEWLPGLGDNLISGLKNSLDQVKQNEGQLNPGGHPIQGQTTQGQQGPKSQEIQFGQHRYTAEQKSEKSMSRDQGSRTQTGMEDTYESFLNVIGYKKTTDSIQQSSNLNYSYRSSGGDSSIPGLDILKKDDGDRFQKPATSLHPSSFPSDRPVGGMSRQMDTMAGQGPHILGSQANKPVSSSSSMPYFDAPISFNRPGVFPSAARLNQILRK